MSQLRLLSLLSLGLSVTSLGAQSLAQLYRDLDVNVSIPASVSAKSVFAGGNSKIDAGLRSLIGDIQAKSVRGLATGAKALDIPVEDNLIAVAISAEQDGASAVEAKVEDLGGTVTATLDDTILARVPASAIEQLGRMRQLDYVAAQGMVRLVQSAGEPGTPNKGVLATKANLLHEQGILGKGVKVGILDFGYTKYKDLQSRGVVPEPKAVKAFNSDGNWDRAGGVEHGAACAEIIHAMAPDAEIYIASVGDGRGSAATDEIIQAGRWLAAQGVDIISFSGGGHGGPHNGTDLLDKLVAEVTGKGILWVNAAGNEGSKHWAGPATLNEQGLVKVGPNGEPYLLVRASVRQVGILVTWDDWGPNPSLPSATQDIDAFLGLVNPQTGEVQLVSQSVNPQNGRGRPQEFLAADSQPGQIFAVFLRGTRLTRAVRVHVHLMAPAQMEPHTALGSIGIPATSPDALSVGAVHVDTLQLEPYSSQGPTDDNRPKPEVAAPANVVSVAYGARFAGTSAACPHVSGFAALLKERNRQATERQLYSSVVSATNDLGVAGTGRGIIDGSKVPGPNRRPDPGPGPKPNPKPGGQIDIPTFFGSSVSAERLNGLIENAREEGAFGAKVVVGQKTYRFGEALKIGYRVREECHYLLIHRSAEGEYTVLAPSSEDASVLRPDKIYRISNIEITPPAGTEHILLICSKEPVDIERLRAGDDEGLSVSVVRYTIEEN